MLLLIDFLNVAYRNFYAIRELSNSKGMQTNAVYGFIQSMRRWIKEVSPTHVAILLDAEKPERRLKLLPEYKANRPPTPEALPHQLEILTRILPLFGWPVAYDPNEEADDLGAALALLGAKEGHEVRIASNDKDFFQILSPKIKLLRSTPKETVLVDEDWLMGRWGIKPNQVVDFLALQGDSVDNIPGVPGVGEKTATDLVQKFGSVDGIFSSLKDISRPKLKESLTNSEAAVRRNMELVRLNPITQVKSVNEFRLQTPRYEPLLKELSELEFKSLTELYRAEGLRASEPKQKMLF